MKSYALRFAHKAKHAKRASLSAWGPGARLRAPGGGPGGEAPLDADVFFNTETAFSTAN